MLTCYCIFSDESVYFSNTDLSSIVTPVNVDVLEHLLVEVNYPSEKIAFLTNGFHEGFSIGYEGKRDLQLMSQNLKFQGVGNETILWNKVMNEVKLSHYAGPFETVPFKHFIQSLIGLVPKDRGCATQLIFHLSYPRGKGLSVNENTPRSLTSVLYPEFDQAI